METERLQNHWIRNGFGHLAHLEMWNARSGTLAFTNFKFGNYVAVIGNIGKLMFGNLDFGNLELGHWGIRAPGIWDGALDVWNAEMQQFGIRKCGHLECLDFGISNI